MTQQLRGLFVPVATPFDRSGELDLPGFRSNLEAHRSFAPAGFVIGGSTGEAALLEDTERLRLVEAARSVARGERVVAGTGGESTRATIRRTRDAATAGADAAMVVAPHYYTPVMTPAALEAHYLAIADASSLPIVLYNIPKYAHFSLPPETVARLARHERVIGIKDSSGDAAILKGFLASQSDTFSVLGGNGVTVLAALRAGARGAVLGVAPFAGELVAELLAAHAAGDDVRASRLQARVAPLAARIVGALGVAGIKGAMDVAGLAGGPVRPPLLPLSEGERREVEALVREARQPVAA